MKISVEQYIEAYNKKDDVIGMFKSGVYNFSKNGSYVPDPYVGFRLREIRSRYLNISKTYRRLSMQISKKHSIENQKIFFYGGSVMFGYYSTSDETTIPGLISATNDKLHTYNYALPAATLSQNFSHYVNKVLVETNDLNKRHKVVCLIGYNEFLSSYRYKLKYGTPVVSTHNALWGPSKIGQFLYKIPGYKFRLGEPKMENFNLTNLVNDTIKTIEVFNSTVEAFGGEFILFIQPSLSTARKEKIGIEIQQETDMQFFKYYQEFNASLIRYFTKKSNIHNLTSIFDRCRFQIYLDQIHIGTKGNEIIAKEILARI